MIITLCASSAFFNKLIEIKEKLEKLGHKVLLPSMNQFKEEDHVSKIKYDLLRKHLKKIDKSDAILVLNFDKNGIKNYIGGNSFLEMGKAYDKGIPIYLLNPIPEISYKDEIIAMQPIILDNNLDKI